MDKCPKTRANHEYSGQHFFASLTLHLPLKHLTRGLSPHTPDRPPAFDVSGSLTLLKIEAEITFAKSTLQYSALLPPAADRMVSWGPKEPTLSQEILLTGPSYQICLNQSLRQPESCSFRSWAPQPSDNIAATPSKGNTGQSFFSSNASVPIQRILCAVPNMHTWKQTVYPYSNTNVS